MLNFSAIANAAWCYVVAHRKEIDQVTCPHTCIIKSHYPKHKIKIKEFPDVPKYSNPSDLVAGTYETELYYPDICGVCYLELKGE